MASSNDLPQLPPSVYAAGDAPPAPAPQTGSASAAQPLPQLPASVYAPPPAAGMPGGPAAPNYSNASWGDVGKAALQALPASALATGKGIAQSLNPLNQGGTGWASPVGGTTWANATGIVPTVAKAAFGAGEELGNSVGDALGMSPGTDTSDSSTAAFNALKQHYGQYTSEGGIKNAIATTPVGTALDAATVAVPTLSAVGKVDAATAAGVADRSGALTAPAKAAVSQAFPATPATAFTNPEFTQAFGEAALPAGKSISSATAKEALLKSQGLPAPTPVVTGIAGPPGAATDAIAAGRQAVAFKVANIAAPLAKDDTSLGAALARARANSLNNIDSLYDSTRDVDGTLTPGFSQGLIDNVHAAVDASSKGSTLSSKIVNAPLTYPQTQAALAALQKNVISADAGGMPMTPADMADVRTELGTIQGMAKNGNDARMVGAIKSAFDDHMADQYSNGALLDENGAVSPNSADLGAKLAAARSAYQTHANTFWQPDGWAGQQVAKATNLLPGESVDDNTGLKIPGAGDQGKAQGQLINSILNPATLANKPGGLGVYDTLAGTDASPGLLDDEGKAALNAHIRQLAGQTNNGVLAAKPGAVSAFAQSPLGQRVFSPEEQTALHQLSAADDLYTAKPAPGTRTQSLVHALVGQGARAGAAGIAGAAAGHMLGAGPFGAVVGGIAGTAAEHVVDPLVQRFTGASSEGAPASVVPRIANNLGTPIRKGFPMAAAANVSQNAQPHANGGRIGRKEGGKVGFDHVAKAASLVRAAAIARGKHNKTTEPLLDQPDEAITKALAIANQHF